MSLVVIVELNLGFSNKHEVFRDIGHCICKGVLVGTHQGNDIVIGCNLFNWIITWVGEKYVSGSDWYFTVLSDYISPTMVIQTICYLLLFRKIKASGFAKKLIKFMAPLVFATYLIDTHPVIYRDVMDGLFTPLTEWNVFLMIAFLIGFGIVFVLAACLIDKVRSLLFKLIRIDKLAGFIADVTVRITNIIGNAK